MSNTALDKVYNVLGCCKIMNDYVFFQFQKYKWLNEITAHFFYSVLHQFI